ncbi:hypothetical protein E2C01_095663 [Portunus trituberculatus]|uniref:Uncharacterized protein n=1 Tax=Portunus trituberculatus TaxID=210409 RepID=A0A5B7K6C2_PORTR|nr:hypothetical protein [Portunus trituberculatus]
MLERVNHMNGVNVLTPPSSMSSGHRKVERHKQAGSSRSLQEKGMND